MREIAVRGFINEKFNTTFGKGLFRRAVFNGSVELRNPNLKYLVDYYQYPEWEAQAKSNDQMDVIHKLYDSGILDHKDLLFSWCMRYDPLTKVKTKVDGYSIYSPDTQELYMAINDPETYTHDTWTLDVHHCKVVGKNKPVFIASNCELATQA
jgi:hypothetical protein